MPKKNQTNNTNVFIPSSISNGQEKSKDSAYIPSKIKEYKSNDGVFVPDNIKKNKEPTNMTNDGGVFIPEGIRPKQEDFQKKLQDLPTYQKAVNPFYLDTGIEKDKDIKDLPQFQKLYNPATRSQMGYGGWTTPYNPEALRAGNALYPQDVSDMSQDQKKDLVLTKKPYLKPKFYDGLSTTEALFRNLLPSPEESTEDKKQNGIGVNDIIKMPDQIFSDYMREVKRGVLGKVARSPQTPLGLALNFYEKAQDTEGGPWQDIKNLIAPHTVLLDKAYNWAARQTDYDEKAIKQIHKSIEKNREFALDAGLYPQGSKDEQFMYKLGSGGASIAESVGLTYLTGNPAIGSLVFGAHAKANTYIEARESGASVDTADFVSTGNFITEFGLEYIGLDLIMNTSLAGKPLVSALLKAGTESVQEASQEYSSNFWAKLGYDKERSLLQGVGESALIGGILGFGTGAIIDHAQRQGTIPQNISGPDYKILEKIVEKQKKTAVDHLVNNWNQLEREVKTKEMSMDMAEIVNEHKGKMDLDNKGEDTNVQNFIDNKLNEATYKTNEDKTIYRGEGAGIGNVTFVNGKYFAEDKNVAKQFGEVTKQTLPAGTKVFDFDVIKNNPDQTIIPDQFLRQPDQLTNFLINQGYEVTKNTGSRGVEYVYLKKNPIAELADIAKRFDQKGDFLEYMAGNDLTQEEVRIRNEASKSEGMGSSDLAWEWANDRGLGGEKINSLESVFNDMYNQAQPKLIPLYEEGKSILELDKETEVEGDTLNIGDEATISQLEGKILQNENTIQSDRTIKQTEAYVEENNSPPIKLIKDGNNYYIKEGKDIFLWARKNNFFDYPVEIVDSITEVDQVDKGEPHEIPDVPKISKKDISRADVDKAVSLLEKEATILDKMVDKIIEDNRPKFQEYLAKMNVKGMQVRIKEDLMKKDPVFSRAVKRLDKVQSLLDDYKYQNTIPWEEQSEITDVDERIVRYFREKGIKQVEKFEEMVKNRAEYLKKFYADNPIIQPSGKNQITPKNIYYTKGTSNRSFFHENIPLSRMGNKRGMLGYILDVFGLPRDLGSITETNIFGKNVPKQKLNLYHGAEATNIPKILEEGFKVGTFPAHAYPQGVYFTTTLKETKNYGETLEATTKLNKNDFFDISENEQVHKLTDISEEEYVKGINNLIREEAKKEGVNIPQPTEQQIKEFEELRELKDPLDIADIKTDVLQKLGYKGFIAAEKGEGKEVVIFDPKNIDKVQKFEGQETNKWGIENVVDIFGGSGFLSIISNQLFPDADINLNEIDSDIHRFWDVAKRNPDGLKKYINLFGEYVHLPTTPRLWPTEIKEKFGPIKHDLLWAAKYLLEYNQRLSGRNVRKISKNRIRQIIRSIDNYAKNIKQFNVTDKDGFEILDNYIENGSSKDFLWIDPPYVWSTGYGVGQSMESPAGFMKLLDKLQQLENKGVQFMFFNNDPYTRFHSVNISEKAFGDLNNMLAKINELEGVKVVRNVKPLGARGRKEIMITNLKNYNQLSKETQQIKELPVKTFADFFQKDDLLPDDIRKEISEAGVDIKKPMTAKQRKTIFGKARDNGLIKRQRRTDRFRELLVQSTAKESVKELTQKEANVFIDVLDKLYQIKTGQYDIPLSPELPFSDAQTLLRADGFKLDELSVSQIQKLENIIEGRISTNMYNLFNDKEFFSNSSIKKEYNDILLYEKKQRHKSLQKYIDNLRNNETKQSPLNQAFTLGNLDLKRLSDIRYFLGRLEVGTGMPFYSNYYHSLIESWNKKSIERNDIVERLESGSSNALDLESQNNIENYFNALYRKKPTPPLSSQEQEFADTLQDLMNDYKPFIKRQRFLDWYNSYKAGENNGKGYTDMKGVKQSTLETGAEILDNKDIWSLNRWLNKQTFGVIEQGYIPRVILGGKAKVPPPKVTSRSYKMLKTRDAVTDQSNISLLQRVNTYFNNLLNLKYLDTPLRDLDNMLSRVSEGGHLPNETLTKIQNWASLLKGHKQENTIVSNILNSMQKPFFKVISTRPYLWLRNLPQRYITAPIKKFIFKKPISLGQNKKKLSDIDQKYFNENVSQFNAMRTAYLLFGQSHKNRFSDAVIKSIEKVGSIYAATDTSNRYSVFRKTLDGVQKIIDKYGSVLTDNNLKKIKNKTGYHHLKSYEQRHFLKLLDRNPHEASLFIAKWNTDNSQWLYKRVERSIEEMSPNQKSLFNLFVWSRGLIQNLSNMSDKALHGRNIRERWAGATSVAGTVIAMNLAQQIIARLVGYRDDDPKFLGYSPIMSIFWTFGGALVPILIEAQEVLRDSAYQAIHGDELEKEQAFDQILKQLDQLPKMFVPMYKQSLFLIEAMSGTQWRDPLSEWIGDEDKIYIDRNALEKLQHALFGKTYRTK